MTFLAFKTVALCLLSVCICMGAGRLLATQTTPEHRPFMLTPFHCVFAGLGMWYFAFLLLVVGAGFALNVVWWLFACVSIVAFFVIKRATPHHEEMEHFWTKMVVSGLLMVPAFFYAASDIPLMAQEMSVWLKNAEHIFLFKGMPDIDKVVVYNIQNLEHPLAATLAALPPSLMAGHFLSAGFAVLNMVVLVLVSGALSRAAGVPVKWSNLPLVSAVSLLGVTFLNPFLDWPTFLSSSGDLLLAGALFAAVVPLLSQRPLPSGWATLPTAFILAFMIGVKVIAFYFYVAIVALWVLRMVVEGRKLTVPCLFGLCMLVMVPLLSWYLWGNHVAASVLPSFDYDGGASGAIASVMALMKEHLLGAVLLLAVVGGALRQKIAVRRWADISALLTQHAWLTLPAFLGVYSLFVGLAMPDTFYFGHVQFVLLLPLWVWARKWYETSPLKAKAYQAPWAIGLVIGVVFMAVLVMQEKSLKETPSPLIAHTLKVSESIKATHLPWGGKVAVLDSEAGADYYAHVMSYGLRNYGSAYGVSQIFKEQLYDLSNLHAYLRAKEADYVWIHTPTDTHREVIGKTLRSDHSYLFSVNEGDFKLEAVYPHLSYTQSVVY